MPISGTRQMMSGGWAIAGLDIKDPSLVFYAPLWYPDSETTGSTIISKDINRHSLTVTGAIWNYLGKPGRWFDQIDDDINCGSGASIDDIWDGGGSFWVWINPASDGEDDIGSVTMKENVGTVGWFVRVGAEAAGFVNSTFAQFFGTTNGTWVTSTAIVPINTWSHILITYNADDVANNPICYLNGISTPLTESSTPVGARVSDAATSLYLGGRGDGSRTFDGYIGEVGGYNKILTAQEALNNYLVTKWRYQ